MIKNITVENCGHAFINGVCVLLMAFVCLGEVGEAQEAEKAKAYKDGMLALREKVVSGHCQVDCVYSQQNGEKVVKREWFIAFDRNFERNRFNCAGPSGETQFASDGNYNYFIRSLQDDIHKSPRGELPGDLEIRPIDVRYIGLIKPEQMLEHVIADAIKREFAHLHEAKCREDGDLVEVTLDCAMKDGSKVVCTFDLLKSQDLYPVKQSAIVVLPGGQHSYELYKSETKAKKVANVWVPIEYVAWLNGGNKYTASFKWGGVNVDMNDEVFSPKSFKVSKDTLVLNHTLKEPFVESVVVANNVKSRAWRPWRISGVLFGLILVGVAVGAYLRSRNLGK